MMNYINLPQLEKNLASTRMDFQSKKPFRYTIIENFFHEEYVERIYNSYPTITNGAWDGTTYIDQKNKFQKNTFPDGSLFNEVFTELNSPAFLEWLEKVTGIDGLLGDEELFGGGLHQSIRGAFLNVHVDYNIHPKTKYHRMLNVLVYMNKDWKDDYEGHLELWDLNTTKTLLEKISPSFNRCVIFETNEISYHGHPKPLMVPAEMNRKSLATYYYTKTDPQARAVEAHNTIYINTEGFKGNLKRLSSGFKAFIERLKK
jgi:Rps23 Pro-64 3,4-dihydroxylase Tpa1-like proline 4-hydroxylase